MSAIGNKKGEITCACQLGGECEGNFSHPSMVCCSYSSDPQTKVIWDLKEKNEKLKREGRRVRAELELRKGMGSDKQEKEIEKLKEENTAEFLRLLDKMAEMERENEKLKEEAESTLVLVQLLKKMKEENDEMNEELWGEAK